jgi:hypothetical protein
VLVALLAFSATSNAQEGDTERAGPNPALVKNTAIAIGTLEEEGEDGVNIVDLHAVDIGPRDRGSFRFFSEEYGYYNGGVREVSCEDGVITAKGAGGFTQPDGTHMAVLYEASFDTNTGDAVITVTGKDDFSYTLEGTVDGLMYCGNLRDAPPTW